MKKVTQAVRIGGEARDVEFMDLGRYITSVDPVGLYQKRSGDKTWRKPIDMYLGKDGKYTLSTSATILNRPGYRLIGWADDKGNSKHISSR